MIAFPNAKINLGLNIINKRQDGYHELETCFYPVPWQEALEIVKAKETIVDISGIEVPDDGDNIVLKAYHLLKSDFDLSPVHIHLHKVIPIGAGLGGGSADAAFALKLLNDLFTLKLSDKELMSYAVRLGADCAFFIKNEPMLATGIGEQLKEAEISLKGKYILLVYPTIHVSTKDAFSKITPKIPEISIEQILTKKNIAEWKGYLKNDFEVSIFDKYPILQEIKKKLYNSGAVYAAMSGSGSCMYGIFSEKPLIDFPKAYTTWSGWL
jgi:4-diphosphocytidyl-2-C-methyl-D-erythritol kinase